MAKNSSTVGWGVIVLAMIFLPPLGIVLVVIKLLGSGIQLNVGNKQASIGSANPYVNPYTKPIEPPVKKSVSCTGCGAPNIVTSNKNCVCEYCGKPLA